MTILIGFTNSEQLTQPHGNKDDLAQTPVLHWHKKGSISNKTLKWAVLFLAKVS